MRHPRLAVAVSSVVFSALVTIVAPATALAQLPFSYIVPPPPGAKIATPRATVHQNTAPGQPRPGHNWFVLAGNTGTLTVTVVSLFTDGLTAQVLDSSNAVLASLGPIAGNEVRASVTIAAVPGAIYRVKVDPTQIPGPGLCACPEYFLELDGATEAGISTPTFFNLPAVPGPPLGDHGPGGSVNWKLNVAPGESLDLRLGPTGDGSTAPNLRMVLIDATDHVQLDERVTPPAISTLPREIHIPDAGNAPGQWTMAIWGEPGPFPAGPYRIFRLSGADTGLYTAWDTDGQGGLDVSIVQGPAPSTTLFLPATDVVVTDIGGFAETKTLVGGHAADPSNSVSLRKLHLLPPPGWTATPADYNLYVTYDATAFLTMRVQDLTPPVLTLPDDITVNATSADGAAVSFDVSATDVDIVPVSSAVTCTSASGSTFAIGQTKVTCTATDTHGNTTTGSFIVNVVDVAVCSAAQASLASIWPPNHQLIDIDVLGVTTMSGRTAGITITGIFQDEATDAEGDGNTAIDGFGVGSSRAQVRAERSGTGDGRVYHISFSASAPGGGSCSGAVTVGVPHDNGHGPAIDGGALFDSTVASSVPALKKIF